MIDIGEFRPSSCPTPDLTVLPGRVAVLMDEVVQGLIITDKEARTAVVFESGVDWLKKGDRVIVKKDHGIFLENREFPWVAPGADVRIYGVACDVSETVLAVLE
jgi:hypothetical protein